MHLGGLVKGAGFFRRDDGHAGADGVAAPRQTGDHGDCLFVTVGLAQNLPVNVHHGIAADDGSMCRVLLLRPNGGSLPQRKLPYRLDGTGAFGNGFIAVTGLHRKAAGDNGKQLPAAGAGAGENDLFHGFGSFLGSAEGDRRRRRSGAAGAGGRRPPKPPLGGLPAAPELPA